MRTAGSKNSSNYKWRITEYFDADKTEPKCLKVFRSIREVQEDYIGLTSQRVADFFRDKSQGVKGKCKDIFSKIKIEKISLPVETF